MDRRNITATWAISFSARNSFQITDPEKSRTLGALLLLANAVERFRSFVEVHPFAGLGILSLNQNGMFRVVGDQFPEIN
jgi:hypothetical protein